MTYPESVVVFVRAMMERSGEDGPCLGPEAHERDGGCDSCEFDRWFDPLPYELRIAAIRCLPTSMLRTS